MDKFTSVYKKIINESSMNDSVDMTSDKLLKLGFEQIKKDSLTGFVKHYNDKVDLHFTKDEDEGCWEACSCILVTMSI